MNRQGMAFTSILSAVCAAALGTTAGGSQSPGICIAETGSSGWCGDGGRAIRAKLGAPRGVAALRDGSFLIADSENHVIRRVRRGQIKTLVGTGVAGEPKQGAPAGRSQLTHPSGLALLPDGGFLIADKELNAIFRVTPRRRIRRVAGNAQETSPGDGGPALAAGLKGPRSVATLRGGGFVVAETGADRIRRVDRDGTITTIAGTGRPGFSGDGGPAAAAQLSQPTGVAVAADDSILIADRGNARVRRVAPDGTIATIIGGGTGPTPAQQTKLDFPTAVVPTRDGSLLVVEAATVRHVTPEGQVAVVAGTGEAGYNGNAGDSTGVMLAYPSAIAALPRGRAYIADTGNDRIRLLDLVALRVRTVAGVGVPGPPGTPEPPPPPGAPPSTETTSMPTATSSALRRHRGKHCPRPGEIEPRRFNDLHILPYSEKVIKAGRPIRVSFAVSRNVRLVARVTKKQRTVKQKHFSRIPATTARTITITKRLKPGKYRIVLKGISLGDHLKRCHSRQLRVKR